MAEEAARHKLSPLAILRHSGKLSGVNLLSAALSFPINILVARQLGPEFLGVTGYVALWQFYASLSKPGISSPLSREVPPLIAAGRYDEATRIQNVGVTGESLYLVIPMTVLLGAAFFHKSPLLRLALVAGAVAFALGQAREFATSIHWAHQRFGLVAKVNFWATLGGALFTAATVWWLNVLTPLLAPAVAGVVALGCFRILAPPIGFRWQFDRSEMWRMAKIGIPLAITTVFYWGFRTVDRTAVAVGLPLADLGYFSFSINFINLAIVLVADFGRVLQPALWAELGRDIEIRKLSRHVRALSLTILAVTCVGANFAQAGFGAFVYWFLPKFAPAISTFEILAFLLACGTAAIIPVNLLSSARIARQKAVMVLYGCGLALNAALAFGAVRAGWGLNGIAVTSVFSQLAVSACLLVLVRDYVSEPGRAMVNYYGSIAGLLLITVGVLALYHVAGLSYVGANPAHALLRRVALATSVWAVVGLAAYGRQAGRASFLRR